VSQASENMLEALDKLDACRALLTRIEEGVIAAKAQVVHASDLTLASHRRQVEHQRLQQAEFFAPPTAS